MRVDDSVLDYSNVSVVRCDQPFVTFLITDWRAAEEIVDITMTDQAELIEGEVRHDWDRVRVLADWRACQEHLRQLVGVFTAWELAPVDASPSNSEDEEGSVDRIGSEGSDDSNDGW